MKELLVVASLLLSGVLSEAQAPYPPSGWRPNGPSFDLPQRPQPLPPQKQQYLPPADPRRPLTPNNFDNGVDVSVQGLPSSSSIEQQPIFEVSPINGQQYTGPSINADIGRLNPSFQQAQYQQQLDQAQQFARQREYEATLAKNPSNGLPNQQVPRQFASETTTTTLKPEVKTAQAETTTEPNLNEGETLDDAKNAKDEKDKSPVELAKQNLQEYPPELFLNTLAQLKLQPQFVPLSQFGQLRAPLYYQPAQTPEGQGFDGPAHLSALPSVLAQRELLSQQQVQGQSFAQNPIIVQQEQPVLVQEPINQYQPLVNNQYQSVPSVQSVQPVQTVQPAQPLQQQVQAFPQFQGQQVQAFPQFQGQPVILPPQSINQIQPNQYPQPQFLQPQPQLQPQKPNQSVQPQTPKDVEEIEQNDQQVVYQNYQPQFYQPQFQAANQYQNQEQPLLIPQPAFAYQNQEQLYPNQFPQQQYDINQFTQQFPQQQYDINQFTQPQDALQSGLDINQQGNDIDQLEEQDQEGQDDEQEENEGRRATAVATAFGARTQPRVFAQYGAPVPKEQENSGYPTSTEAPIQDEPIAEDGPAIAQATAVATNRRNARLRSRRVRPVFTVDRSGHLVLAQQ